MPAWLIMAERIYNGKVGKLASFLGAMNKVDDTSTLAGFYLSLVSIMQSLALGYLLQLFSEKCSKNALSPTLFFQGASSLAAIILVWHQYAIGTVNYRWRLGMQDSIIPYFVGISEYLMIAAMGLPETRIAVRGGPFTLWLCSLVVFTSVSIWAYRNQYRKAERQTETDAHIAVSKRGLKCTVAYLGMFILLAIVCWIWALPQRFQWAVSLFISLAFLGELWRVSRAYDSVRG